MKDEAAGVTLTGLERVARTVGADPHRWGDARISDVTDDSHSVRPGTAFVALAGSRQDGHQHAADAVDRGAAALIVSRRLELPVPQLVVADTRAAAGHLAAEVHGRPSQHLAVIGVTGTNGKTTATHLIEAAAHRAGLMTGLVGTVEAGVRGSRHPATLTTPQATDLQRILADVLSAGAQAVAMEVSSHALDQDRVAGTRFETALFTNLEPEHLEYHGSMEAYLAAKAKLFSPASTRRGVICVDDAWGRRLAARCRIPVTTYAAAGREADVTYRVVGHGLGGLAVAVDGASGPVTLRSRLVGRHTAATLVGAYLSVLGMGLDPAAAAEGLASAPRAPGRFELVDRGQPFLVVVDYAHTPRSLAALVDTARELTGPAGRVHVVVGARGGRDRRKRIGTARAAARADRVFLTTDNPGDEDPAEILRQLRVGARGAPPGKVTVIRDRRAAIRAAVAGADAGDAVIIAGRGHETSMRVGGRTIVLDDRQVAARAVEARYVGVSA